MTLDKNTVKTVKDLAQKVRNASKVLALASNQQKTQALMFCASAIRSQSQNILQALLPLQKTF